MDAGLELRRAIALLKSSEMMMGSRDKAYDMIVSQAVAHLENARAGIGVGPGPSEPQGLEPSIVEWIYGAADAALASASAMPADAAGPSQAEVLSGALLSIREWAERLSKKPAPEPRRGAISTPRGVR